MNLLAQHGYGKGNKIDRALNCNDLSGVILSPKGESPHKMAEYIQALNTNNPEAKVYFDPQFHACCLQGEITAGKLVEYPYFSAGLTRAHLSAPANIRRYASSVINYQRELGLTDFFSPTISFDDFNGRESQTGISLAYESIEITDAANNLYVSLYINETAFRNREALEEFLNVISLFDVKGFYIVVERVNNTDKATAMTSNILSNLMWFVYILSEVNGFDVIVGYSDFLSLPLSAISNASFACGWYNNLKMYSEANFRPSPGGRRPRKRYTSGVLMSSLLLLPEIVSLNRMGILSQIESPSPYNEIIRPNLNDAEWTDEVSCLHNWHVLKSVLNEIEILGSVPAKLDFVTSKIINASEIYRAISERGFQLDAKSGGSHLSMWLAAISDFRIQAGI